MHALDHTSRTNVRRTRHVAAALMSSAVFLAGGAAFAQAAAAPAAAPAAPAASAAPSPTSAAPAAGSTQADGDSEGQKARFRWGISGMGGPYFQGGNSAGAGGVDVRLGVQLTDKFAVYGQPAAIIGGGASAGPGGAKASALVMGSFGALADLTIADLFYVAAGPELVSGTIGSAGTSGTSATAGGAAGTFFSVAARVGLALGSVKPDRRKAFSIGGDFRVVFTPGGATVIPFLALGYESF